MKPLIILLFASSLSATITNVSVTGVTQTQAIIQYTAPSTSACTLEVSESASYSPVVHDVDTTIFTGSNSDSRAGSIPYANQRTFIAGTRKAQQGSDSHWYSRALQANTKHYFRITCGSDTATGTFTTLNPPMGNTYTEAQEPDPAVTGDSSFVSVGRYAMPEFTDYTSGTAQKEAIIDPKSGLLLRRLNMPFDVSLPADHTFTTALSPTGNWSNPTNILTDTGATSVFSGAGQDVLVLLDNALTIPYPIAALTVSIKGACTAGGCVGDNAKIQVCLTTNGVTCSPQSTTQDMTLAGTSTFATVGSVNPIMAVWTPTGYPALLSTDLEPRNGVVSVDSSGNVTWNTDFPYPEGQFFGASWTTGTHITINGSDCTITTFTNTKNLKVTPASCSPALTVPASNVAWSAGTFGIIIKKKTTSTDTITLEYAKYTVYATKTVGGTASGNPDFCSQTATQDTVTGELGYRCNFSNGFTYWISSTSGDAHYLGPTFLPGHGSASPPDIDGWPAEFCNITSQTFIGTTPTAPEKFYCISGDQSAVYTVVLECTMTSSNEPGDLTIGCTNLTLPSTGKDLKSLMAAFTASEAVPFDNTKFNCGLYGIQNSQLMITCKYSAQDTLGWTFVFDPAKVDTAAGCVGGGNPGCIIAGQDTWSKPPVRWCNIHTPFVAGESNTAWVLGKFQGIGAAGSGPYISTVTSTALTSTPTISAGTGTCPIGSDGCDNIVVDGEPCKTVIETTGGVSDPTNCPKNGSWSYLQNAAVNDIFLLNVPGNNGEYVRLNVKTDSTHWQIERGYGFTTPQTPSTPNTLNETCTPRDFSFGASGSDWIWDFHNDPHANNVSGTTVQVGPGATHPVVRADVVIEGGYNLHVGNNYIPLNKFYTEVPKFANTFGVTNFGETAQDHPTRPQNKATGHELKTFVDNRSASGPGPDLNDQSNLVAGTTTVYKFASTTTDGDNLTQVGGSNAFLGGLNRKIQSTLARCGAQPVIDISSSTQGNVIDDTKPYTYCVSRLAGECRSSSSQGDVYVACPHATARGHANPSNSALGTFNTFGCSLSSAFGLEGVMYRDMCVYNMGSWLQTAVQINYEYPQDAYGLYQRALTYGLNKYVTVDPNQNSHGMTDGSWFFMPYESLGGIIGSGFMLGKVWPQPNVDSINRTTFVPITVNVSASNTNNVIIAFGYAENGPVGNYWCTSRQESCYATLGSINEAVPFSFPTDGTTTHTLVNVTGLSCASGCSVVIPALANRVLYYQIVYRDSSNNIMRMAPPQTVAVP